MRLYSCRRIVSFLTEIETFFVTDVTEYVTTVPVLPYVAYVLCALLTSACISTFGLHTVMGIKIEV